MPPKLVFTPKRSISPQCHPILKKPRVDAHQENVNIDAGRGSDWPASHAKIEEARRFIRDCAERALHTIIVPDKDADGLSAGLILYRTLASLGLSTERLHVHFLLKGTSIFSSLERERLNSLVRSLIPNSKSSPASSPSRTPMDPAEARIIIVDQGSRPSPPLIDSALRSETLIIDHHQSDEFPEAAQVLTACRSPPIATSSLLTYLACLPLLKRDRESCAWLALIGIHGDLGASAVNFGTSTSKNLKRQASWPDREELRLLGDAAKTCTKKALGQAVSLLNGPRRTPEFNVRLAWDAILDARSPADIVRRNDLLVIRERINAEIARCGRSPPCFSKDGRIALIRIDSAYQVHPVIATRWAGSLKGKALEIIMVVNPSHHPDPNLVSFACRLSKRAREMPEVTRPNIIQILKDYGEKVDVGLAKTRLNGPNTLAGTSDDVGSVTPFLDRVGDDYARGHKEASGGIICKDAFEQLVEHGLEISGGSGSPGKRIAASGKESQSRSLLDFFPQKQKPSSSS
ncbi:hypothetical protein HGRIS_012047 [Hohenbuehelia grisea]|uniref:DDH domain-containing protein n=1 Tax=Hohenbuehelia grisea TaxID=104357 RepID=A0ABR3IR53_9AGAR